MNSELEENAQVNGTAATSEEPPAMTISLAQSLPSPGNRRLNTASHTSSAAMPNFMPQVELPEAGGDACANVGPMMSVCGGVGPEAGSNGFAQMGPMSMPSSSMQLGSNVVFVAVAVPVQVPHQSNMRAVEPSMPYVCAPQQQCPLPMHGEPTQWLLQNH
jgi:hypothetical protein